MDETILTLAELKKALDIASDDSSQDESLTVLQTLLPQYLFDQTGTWFGSAKETSECKDYDSVVFLDNYPVIEIQEVRLGYNSSHDSASMRLVGAPGYRWNREGRLMLSKSYDYATSRFDYDEVYIKYTYGILAVPVTVKEAAKLFSKAYWTEGENGGQTVTSIQAGSYKETYQPSDREQTLLAPFVKVRV